MSNDTAYSMHTCGYKKCAPCYRKGYESREVDFVCEYLDKLVEVGKLNGQFVDIGAHVGLWALQMSEWYRCRYQMVPNIIALEPDTSNFVALKQNANQDNTGITPVQVACWHKNEWLYLDAHEHPARHQVSAVKKVGASPMRVRGVAFDTVTEQASAKQIDAIKIDVEGAELNVLNGMRQTLIENEHLLIVIEYSVGHFAKYGYTPTMVSRFMEAHNFRPVRKEDMRVVQSIGKTEIKRVIFVKGDV